ncbi:EamA family transporter [Flavobacteriaceae bacterium TP-CH-4]|uniref:EamA family transporter n=2 Tax=Pelagihabitans pacificus TaxID=2696054 RepID=A0A967ASP7_9FLAO|nr:EamA family transporter [Pelagihabitans pacificus]
MLLLGTSGPFGKYIDLPVPLTIEIRALLALLFLLGYCKWKGLSFRLRQKDVWPIILSGFLMCLHWTTYFKSLQLSNVAIGMLSLFTYPVWTAFLEPLFLKTRFQKIHLLLGILVLAGIYLLVPEISFGNSQTLAIGFGICSALCYAVRNLILKTKVAIYQGSVLMSYQLFITCIVLFPTYFFYDLGPVVGQWKGLLGVALITTAMGHTMFINTFRSFSVTTISILSSIQPVYGIIIGVLFMAEIPYWSTVLGGILILFSVVIESIRSYR